MGVLAHYVPIANAYGGALGRHPDYGTEGATWRYVFEGLSDENGALIPQATIETFTCECKVYSPAGAVLVSPTFAALGAGSFSLTFDETSTAGLAASRRTPRSCSWSMRLLDGSDVVQFWKVTDSPFAIHPAETY